MRHVWSDGVRKGRAREEESVRERRGEGTREMRGKGARGEETLVWGWGTGTEKTEGWVEGVRDARAMNCV